MGDNENARERRLRRNLAKGGYRLHKTPGRHWLRQEYGPGYMITKNNTVVWGCTQREYDLTLVQAEDVAAELTSETE